MAARAPHPLVGRAQARDAHRQRARPVRAAALGRLHLQQLRDGLRHAHVPRRLIHLPRAAALPSRPAAARRPQPRPEARRRAGLL